MMVNIGLYGPGLAEGLHLSFRLNGSDFEAFGTKTCTGCFSLGHTLSTSEGGVSALTFGECVGVAAVMCLNNLTLTIAVTGVLNNLNSHGLSETLSLRANGLRGNRTLLVPTKAACLQRWC